VSSTWAQQQEAGSPALMRAFARLCLALGPRLARLLLGPVCLYFFLVKRQARKASRAFLARALGRPATWREQWRHFWTFSQVLLDRVYLLGGDSDAIKLTAEQPEALAELVDAGKGCLLLGSHLGSFEASRAIKRNRPSVQLRLVMDRSQSPAATAFLEALNPELAAQVLDLGAQPGAGLGLLGALQDQSLVALLADRVRGEEKTVTVDFMGKPARFPAAPHEIAMVTQAPVVMFWGLHEGSGRYRVIFERLPAAPRVQRQQREAYVRESAQRFADRLAHHAREAPFNWFNFYDFWAGAS